MNLYQKNTVTVLDYLSEVGVCQSVYDMSHSCFTKLGRHLSSRNIDFSLKEAEKWLDGLTLSDISIKMYSKAIRQLGDVYNFGHVCFLNRTNLNLKASFDEVISEYLNEISGSYTPSHLKNIRNRCRFFFGFMQMDRGISNPSGIGYEDILSFHRDLLPSLCKADYCMYKGSVSSFLLWMAEMKLCPTGFSMLLSMNHAEKAAMLDDLSSEASLKVREIGGTSYKDFPPTEFLDASVDFIRDLEKLGYADTMLTTARLVLDMLFLFLDMNHIGYIPDIASVWYAETGDMCFGKNKLMARRILGLFAVFTEEGSVRADIHFTYKPLLSEELPAWCREALELFLKQKVREKWAASTICMYRSSVTRFCRFLADEGITSFTQIDAEVLKKFNLADVHSTPEGKNAYNVRIRKFLFYLAEDGFVDNYCLGNALPCVSAPSTGIVKILMPEEESALEGYIEEDQALGLRNRAILLLGLSMGMRGSDITSLTFEQIDWRASSISFLQEKTDVERVLPMPADAGNALFRYIMEGRPESASGYVFITHKAPYRKIGRGVCRKIMLKALPKEREDGYGFHVTRRTYATKRFRSSCGYSDVAYLLGHSTDDTAKKYISIDEERMRCCPVPLSDAGIPMKGGFRNE